MNTIPADPDARLDNFRGSLQVDCQPNLLPLYRDLRLTLTRNVDKARGYVNGMGATVEGLGRYGVRVRLDTGAVMMMYPLTEDVELPDGSWKRVTFFPCRLGYSTTLHKVQGATLKHITVFLDIPNVEAAGYVALSRVATDDDWRFLGQMTVHHFTPASGI